MNCANRAQRFRQCVSSETQSVVCRLLSIILVIGYANTTNAQPLGAQEPSVKIQWLTVFDHRALLRWPPDLTESGLANAVLEKLKNHLKLARQDIEYVPFIPDKTALRALRTMVKAGEHAYQSLKHRQAAAHLSKALDEYYALGWHLFKPIDVSHVQLLLGKTRLEQGKEVDAERLFRMAMSLNPRLEIREEFEHPNTVRLLKQTRRSFLTRPPELPKSATHTHQKIVMVQVHGRLVNDRLELMINSAGGTRMEVELINGNLDRAVSRISTRILDCLPLSDTFTKESTPPSVITSLGMGLSSYARSPVGPFIFYDTIIDFQYQLSRDFEWWTNLRLSNSGPDESEHIRNTITSLSLSFGPRPRFHFGRMSVSFYLAPWIERRGKYESTTNPACKFFSPESEPPTRLCNFEGEVKSYAADWVTGVAIGTQLQVRLARKFSLLWATSAHSKILEEVSTSMQYLLGSHVSLGYEF